MEIWTDGKVNRWKDGKIDGRMAGWQDGEMDGWKKRKDGQMKDGHYNSFFHYGPCWKQVLGLLRAIRRF